ncbi:MAG: hypothetical protein KC609_23925 [Myxococcales bacterium]|nr:hypothetical protein [Myxococcales bacterium]
MAPFIISVAILIALYFIIRMLRHLFGGQTEAVQADDPRRLELVEERNRYLDALRELEDDYAMNKISADDKRRLEALYTQRALDALETLEREFGSGAAKK